MGGLRILGGKMLGEEKVKNSRMGFSRMTAIFQKENLIFLPGISIDPGAVKFISKFI
jgi:hypothetical protein